MISMEKIDKIEDELTAKSWIVVSNENKPLFFKKHYKRREIASLTKIMTCLISLEILNYFKIDPKSLKLRVSKQASEAIGTSADL